MDLSQKLTRYDELCSELVDIDGTRDAKRQEISDLVSTIHGEHGKRVRRKDGRILTAVNRNGSWFFRDPLNPKKAESGIAEE